MPEVAVQALYDDDIVIAKMIGFINLKPRWLSPPGCSSGSWQDRMAGEQWPVYFKAGLYKQELTAVEAGVPPFVNPNVGDDWTDVTALKRWQHIWQPRGRHGVNYQQPEKVVGVCHDVSQAGYTVPPTGSGTQATYNVPAITTDCCDTLCRINDESCDVSDMYFEREEHAWHRMSLNRRTPVRLHENDSLDIFMNWSIPRPEPACDVECGPTEDGVNPCAMQFSIQLAAKFEFG